MDGIRVGTASLRLTAPASLSGADLERRAAREFLPAVLAAAERRLRARFGAEAVLRAPRLDLRLRVSVADIASSEAIEAVGEDIAWALAARAVGMAAAGGRAGDPDRPRLYADRAEFLALRLAAAGAGETGPEGREDPDTVWREMAASGEAVEAAVLHRALALERLEPALQWLGPRRRTELAERLGPRLSPRLLAALAPAPERRPAARSAGSAAPRDPPPEAAAAGPRPPPSGTKGDGLDAATRASGRVPPPEPGEGAERAAVSPAAASPSGPEPAAPFEAWNGASAGQPDPAASPVVAREASPPPAKPGLPPADAATPDLVADGPGEARAEIDEGSCHDLESRWCPLLGLLNLSFRLELPERLWKVGLDEGDALAAIFARLIGGDDDPAARVLSARFPEPARPLGRLAAWARRDLTEGCREAAAELAGLDLGSRAAAIAAWYGDGDRDLGAWGAGLHLALAEVCLGREIAPGAMAGLFGGVGRIVVDAGTIRVIQPMEAVDIEKRLAGLDLNPGWLAWLRKRLDFVFEPEPS